MKVIGVAGFARAGKDTFVSIAKDILEKNGIIAKQYSFAGVLKQEVAPFLRDQCGCDVYTNDSEVKADMRDFLVWYGTTWWRKRDPKRWIRNVDLAMKADKDKVDIALISDVRYPNEGEWVHSWSGYLVHISAYKLEHTDAALGWPQGGDYKIWFSAPNEQEKINDPIVKGQSDYKLEWESKGLTPQQAFENEELRSEVRKALNSSHLFSVMLSL